MVLLFGRIVFAKQMTFDPSTTLPACLHALDLETVSPGRPPVADARNIDCSGKLTSFGSTVAMAAASTPNHSARPYHTDSHGVVGTDSPNYG